MDMLVCVNAFHLRKKKTKKKLVLESAVAIIQSYVFAILSTLYSSEVN